MFIRVQDNIQLTNTLGKLHTPLLKKKKDNLVKHFYIDFDNQEKCVFYDSLLNIKMIPKDWMPLFSSFPIKYLELNNSKKIIFQELKSSPCHFLSPSQEDHNISFFSFNELNTDMDLLCYNCKSNEYYYQDVIDFRLLYIEDDEELYLEMFNQLSRYLLFTPPPNGIILNSILVC